jgi:CO/xanthine dehydrogenase FAD-binding subunit
MAFLRPTTTQEAVEALRTGPWTIVAGATDHYPARVGRSAKEDVLDVTAIAGLRAITRTDTGWSFGALTTWRDIIDADMPARFDGLRAAAHTIGGVQIQNRATLAGNVCNASPAADGVPVLLSLDASVELTSAHGQRRQPIAEFITGNRATERRPDEFVTAVHTPDDGSTTRSAFLKLGSRSSLVISIVMTAGAIGVDDGGVVESVALSVGACSAVAIRLTTLEGRLLGVNVHDDDAWAISTEDLAEISPIDDIRGSAEYRQHAAEVLVQRLLDRLRT